MGLYPNAFELSGFGIASRSAGSQKSILEVVFQSATEVTHAIYFNCEQ